MGRVPDADRPKAVKHPKRQVTTKQRLAIKIAAENGGNISQAMIAAGYSPQTAKTPQKLTESEYVQALMREVGLRDVDGFQLLKEGMQSTKTVVMGKEEDSFVDIQPDYAVRHKYLETFVKIRGFSKEAGAVGGGIHFHQHTGDKKQTYAD